MADMRKAILPSLHVFALAAFAVGLPILDVLRKSQAFFVFHKAGPTELVGLAVVVGFLVPCVIASPVLLSSFFGERMYRITQTTAVWVLLSAFWMPMVKGWELLSLAGFFLTCLVFGAILSYGYFRFRFLQHAASILVLGAIIPSALFLFQLRSLLVVEATPNLSQRNDTTTPDTPVFFILFDEFSTASLLDSDGGIDARHFPNIAALAESSHWFRNATAVADMTPAAVPAILTGRYHEYPKRGFAPDIPENLFRRFLEGGYEVYAVEQITRYCPESMNLYEGLGDKKRSHFSGIMSDVAVLSGHIFLHWELARELPGIQGRVGGFVWGVKEKKPSGSLPEFLGLVDSIDVSRGRLYFGHFFFPHSPYRYLPSGKVYAKPGHFLEGLWKDEFWPPGQRHEVRAYQRYLYQVQYLDSLLGRLLDKIRATGLYDDALIVVTADHGVNFRPGYRRYLDSNDERGLKNTDAAMDILKVPTFIKLPSQTKGVVVDDAFQTIDIMPTVLGVLGLEGGDGCDGRNVFSESTENLTRYRALAWRGKVFVEHELDLLSNSYDMGYKHRVLDGEWDFAMRVPGCEKLLGRTVESIETVSVEDTWVSVYLSEPLESVDIDGGTLPAMVIGKITLDMDECAPGCVAIALNGTIYAVDMPFHGTDGGFEFSVILPEKAFRDGKNELEIFGVDSDVENRLKLRKFNLRMAG